MIPDQHRLPRLHGWIEAAGGVRQDNDPGTGDHRGPDRVDHLGRGTAFVKVGAPDEQEDPVVAHCERAQLTVVAGNRRRRESWEVTGGPLGLCGPEPVGDALPAGTENDRHVVGRSSRPAVHLGGGLGRKFERGPRGIRGRH